MKFKIMVLLVAQVAMSGILFAQVNLKVLRKGDFIPGDLVFEKMVNYKSKKAKFTEFKGKLLILDFWATYCGPCVAALPRMDSLQEKFGDRIAIIPITPENGKKIMDYITRKKYKLPSVVEDTILNKVFPQTALDLHVWINEDGKIIATTSGEEVNDGTIDLYLKTGNLAVKERIDLTKIFSWEKDLFVDGNGGSGNEFIARSILAKAIIGINGNGARHEEYPKINNTTMYKSISCYNVYVSSLFDMVFSKGRLETHAFIEKDDGNIVPITNASNITDAFSSVSRWMATGDQSYCYSLSLPFPGVRDSVFYRKYMLEDLNRYFDFTARIEKRKVSSWIIVKKNESKIAFARKDDPASGGERLSDMIDGNYLEGFQNWSMTDISRKLSDFYYMSPPLFNETGLINEKIYMKNLHLKLNKDHANRIKPDIEEWRSVFRINGFDIKVEDREIEVMIFKKKKGLIN